MLRFLRKSDKGDEPTEIDTKKIDMLAPFTDAAKDIHDLMGFPGVLLLFALATLTLDGFKDILAPAPATFIGGLALVCSVVTYFANRFLAHRRAVAESKVILEFKMMLAQKYLELGPQQALLVRSVVTDIVQADFAALAAWEGHAQIINP